ncbi:hypothetical protein KY285_022339 [Solanum tuberosum]|nr:hypothetical protein KY285_022339 [Solanum tuberosum]
MDMTQIGSRISESGGSNDSIPNTSSPNEVEVDTSNKRKNMEPRATCWKHFDKFTDESGAKKAKCKYCEKSYAASTSTNGTSAMNNHMRICLKFPRDTVDKGQNLINFLPSSTGAKEGVISTWKFDQAQSRRALAKMIIVDELPFNFVEKEGFKNFMRVTVPQFHNPSRRTVTRDCYELYLEERQLLKKVFKEALDNASSNDVTVKEMSKKLSNWGTNIMDGDHLHVRCMAHILNLIVQDGLKEIGKSIKLVRQAVKYIKQSPARLRKFKECCESQLIACKKLLCLDVPTRWNSTYSMLDVAQHFELAFERYSFYDIGYLNHLRTFGYVSSEDEDRTSDEDGTSANILTSDILTSADWKNVRSMMKFLETFYVLTVKVSGSNYVTSNTHFVEIAELNLILKEMMENEDGNLKEIAKSINEKFKKYWGEPHKMNKMIFISFVLDPRNKLDYVPFAIVDMFGKEVGDKLCSKVKKYMKNLFDYYVKKSSKISSHVPSSPTSSNNSSSISSVSGCDNFVNRGRMRTKQQFEKHKEVSGSSDWLRSEPFPINIEEDLEYLEQLEFVATCKFNYQLVKRGNGHINVLLFSWLLSVGTWNLGVVALDVAQQCFVGFLNLLVAANCNAAYWQLDFSL